MRHPLVVALSGALLLAACGSDSGAASALQSACVRSNLNLPQTQANGSSCDNFSYSDCGAGNFASTCTGVCAHKLCQKGTCSTDADCTGLAAALECSSYVVSGIDLGRYCGKSSCPKGTPGCPCSSGSCAQTGISGQTVTCSAAGTCVMSDTCRSGCRQGSVCCGGAFCAGNCIGTPCC